MAGESFSVEIPITIIDGSTAALGQIGQKLKGLDTIAKATQTGLGAVGKTSATAQISLMDKVTPALKSIAGSLENFSSKSYKATLSIVDNVTAPLRGIAGLATSTLGILGIGAGAGGIVAGGILGPLQYAGGIEKLRIAFTGLLGSEKAATDYMGTLRDFANRSPYSQQSVFAMGQGLVSSGYTTNESMVALKAAADATAARGGTAETMQSLTRMITAAAVQPRAQGGGIADLEAMGIPASKLLGEYFQVNPLQLQDFMSSNVVTGRAYADALTSVLEKAYPDAAKNANKGLLSMLTTLSDNFKQTLGGAWGQGLIDVISPRFKSLTEWIDKNGMKLKEWESTLQQTGRTVGEFIVSRVERLGKSFSSLLDSPAFRNASLGEKIGIVWNSVIVAPFNEWWNASGKAWVADASNKIGGALGEGIGSLIAGLFGVKADGAASVGVTVGSSFAQGFLAGVQKANVGKAVADAILPKGLGGQSESVGGSVASVGLLALVAKQLGLFDLAKGALGFGGKALNVGRGAAGAAETAATVAGSNPDALLLEGSAGAGGLARVLGPLGLLLGLYASGKEIVTSVGNIIHGPPQAASTDGLINSTKGVMIGADQADAGTGSLLDDQTIRLTTDFRDLADVLESILRDSTPSYGPDNGGGGSGGSGGSLIDTASVMPGYVGTGSGDMPAAGDIRGWRNVLAGQVPASLAGNQDFLNTVLAGAKAESGLNPNRIEDGGGGGRGFFQFDLGGMGKGLSNQDLFSEPFQASRILPQYAAAWQSAPLNLMGADKAAWVAAHAERPAGYDDPLSPANQRYRNAYNDVAAQPSVTIAPGAIVNHFTGPLDPTRIVEYAQTMGDAFMGHIATKIGQASANIVAAP